MPQSSKEETQLWIALTSSSVEKQPGEPHTSPSHREIRACVHSSPSRLFSGLTKQQEVEEINSQDRKCWRKKAKPVMEKYPLYPQIFKKGKWAAWRMGPSCCHVVQEQKGMDSRHSADRVGPQRQLLPPFKCKLFVPPSPLARNQGVSLVA